MDITEALPELPLHILLAAGSRVTLFGSWNKLRIVIRYEVAGDIIRSADDDDIQIAGLAKNSNEEL